MLSNLIAIHNEEVEKNLKEKVELEAEIAGLKVKDIRRAILVT
jgi:hypothetical protein